MSDALRVFVLRDETNFKMLGAFLRHNYVAMAQAGKPLSVIVAEHKAKRNNQQNALYWAMLSEIADSAWMNGKQFSKEAWHAFFASEFLGWEDIPGGRKVPASTSRLSVPAFADYIDRIAQFAAEELSVQLGVAA